MKKIKILYLIDKMDVGGTQKHILDIFRFINRDKFEPHLCCLLRVGDLRKELIELGIGLKTFNIKRIYGYSGIRDILALINYIKKEQFDIVHTYLFLANLAGNIAAKIARTPIIISGRRDTGIHREGKYQHRLAYRFVHKLADRVFTVSNSVRNIVHKYEGVSIDKIVTIYNGIEINKLNIGINIDNGKKELGINKEDKVVGIISNLNWVKGHKIFIEVAKLILKEMSNTKFLIIGDGPLKNTLLSIVYSQRLADKILFLGKIQNIPEILSMIDVSVNTSYSEGMSNTILESMALGVPVVATDVDGNRELIMDNQTGFLVPLGDVFAMKEKIIILLKNKIAAKQMAENAKNFVRDNFNLLDMINRIENTYIDLLDKKYNGYSQN